MSLAANVTLASAIKPPSLMRALCRIDADIRSENEKLERARARFEKHKAVMQRRAKGIWDIDQRARVATLALKLKRNPHHVVARLMTSLHGCKYLMERWAYLIKAVGDLKFTGELKPSDRVKALCLLSIDPDEWDVVYPIDLPEVDRAGADWRFVARNALNQIFIKELRRLSEIAKLLEVEDQEVHADAMAGEFLVRDKDKDLLLHERTIATCERQLRVLHRERTKARHESPPTEVPEVPPPPEVSVAEPPPSPPTPDPLL